MSVKRGEPQRVKRVAFGMRNFANYRIRSLLYAGKSNWTLLDTITPPSNPKLRYLDRRHGYRLVPSRVTMAHAVLDGSFECRLQAC